MCALYIPEVRFGNVTTMEPIILQLIPPERFNKVKMSPIDGDLVLKQTLWYYVVLCCTFVLNYRHGCVLTLSYEGNETISVMLHL